MQVQDSVTHGIAGSATHTREILFVLFVILGSDRALAKRALDRQLSALDPGGIDTDRIEAADRSYDAMLAAVTAVPFLGSQRVIVIQGLLGQTASKGGKGGKANAGFDLGRLVGSIPETTHLILFDPELSELSATAKKQLPANTTVVVNVAPRGNALVELAQDAASRQYSSLDKATARALLDRLFPAYWPQAPANRAFDKPPSVERLESEIAKLALASYPGPITSEIIDEMIPQRSEERIFPLLDAVIGGDQRGAIAEVENACRAGEDASRSLAQLYQQVELAVVVTATGRPADPFQAGRALGLANAGRMQPVERAVQRARVAPIRQLRLALESDRKLKTGRIRNPDEGLLDLVVRVTNPTENR